MQSPCHLPTSTFPAPFPPRRPTCRRQAAEREVEVKSGNRACVEGRWWLGKEDRQRVREERLFGGENHKWWVLATVGVGVLMATLDASIVNIALPTILEDLNTNLLFVQWVLEAYLLAITVLLLPFGRLSDIVGRKRVYSAGFLIFVLGSGLSGFSRTAEELIAFRVLQAVGAAMILANGFAIVTAVFPPWQRGTALGSLGTVVAAGFALGPTVGGLLIDSLGWPWIFYVNVPIGIIGTTAAWVILNERVLSGGRRQSPQRFDFAGAVLSVLALLALLMALTLGPEVGWISPLVLLLGAAFVLLTAAFFVVEARLEQPLVDLSLFRRRTFTAGNVAGIMAFLAISANAFLMPFYLQLVQGYSPLQAGLLLTPTALVLAVVAPISGWLSDRIGARILSSVGLAINGVALLLLGSLSVDASYTQVLYWLLLLGFGQGMFQAPNNSSVMGDVPRDRLGIGSGILSMVRNLGQVVGLAVSASFLLGSLATVGGPSSLGAIELGTLPSKTNPELLSAFMVGFHDAYLAATGFAAVGVVASLVRAPRAAPPVSLVERQPAAGKERAERPRRRARG